MNVLEFATLMITGFVACAEFGSYAFVHPVIRRLPPAPHLQVEQGLLRTFGRVMPVGMTLCVVLAIANASATESDGGSQFWGWSACAAFILALVSTIVFNVPINLATGKWEAEDPPPDWKQTRNRWELFQGVRSWLLLIGFVLICAAAAME